MSPHSSSPNQPGGSARLIVFILLAVLCSQPLLAAITLDPTFGVGGKVTVDFPDASPNYTAFGRRLFIQPSGRIVAGGMFTNRGPDGQFPGVGIAGLLSNGDIDVTYGSAGRVRDWESVTFTSFGDMNMYPDGRLIRVSQRLSLSFPNNGPRVARLNVDGTSDGIVADVSVPGTTNTIPLEVAVRPDGKIYILTYAQTSPASNHLFRLNPDGSRDTTFGVNGVKLMDFSRIGGASLTLEMELLTDGRIVLAGEIGSSTPSGFPEFCVLRLSPDGHLDKSFGLQGVLRMPFATGQNGFLENLYIQSDGKILLVGGISNPDLDLWMKRFTPKGKADGSFGSAGVVLMDFAPGANDFASGAASSSDGKIRIAGQTGTPSTFLIARYTAGGQLEEHVTTAFAAGQACGASDLVVQPDGKIVAIGFTPNPNTSITGNVWAIARYTE